MHVPCPNRLGATAVVLVIFAFAPQAVLAQSARDQPSTGLELPPPAAMTDEDADASASLAPPDVDNTAAENADADDAALLDPVPSEDAPPDATPSDADLLDVAPMPDEAAKETKPSQAMDVEDAPTTTASPYDDERDDEETPTPVPSNEGTSTGVLVVSPLLGLPAGAFLVGTAVVGIVIGFAGASLTSNYLTRVLGFETASAIAGGVIATVGIMHTAVVGGGLMYLVNWIFLSSGKAAVLAGIGVGAMATTAIAIAGVSIPLAIGSTDTLTLLGPAVAAPFVGAIVGGVATAIAAPFVVYESGDAE